MSWRSTTRAGSARSIWSRPTRLPHSARSPRSGPSRWATISPPATSIAAFAGRIAPVKPLLLDQRIVAGLGNIYVCEALHRAGIRPDRAAGQIARKPLDRLVPAIKAVLAESIAAGGSTIRDYAQPNGELGYFAASWRVYGREGEACRCGGTVQRLVQGGRSTFWCAQVPEVMSRPAAVARRQVRPSLSRTMHAKLTIACTGAKGRAFRRVRSPSRQFERRARLLAGTIKD